MSVLPNNPMILLSFVNTQLRDSYPSLEEFCKSYMEDEKAIVDKLANIDYHYNPQTNKFE